jgi:hypothetical protein
VHSHIRVNKEAHKSLSFLQACYGTGCLIVKALPPFQCQLSVEESICLPVFVQNEISNLVSVYAYKAESCRSKEMPFPN